MAGADYLLDRRDELIAILLCGHLILFECLYAAKVDMIEKFTTNTLSVSLRARWSLPEILGHRVLKVAICIGSDTVMRHRNGDYPVR